MGSKEVKFARDVITKRCGALVGCLAIVCTTMLSAAQFAVTQVPVVTIVQDEHELPELKAKLWWEDVEGAQSYNVYRYSSAFVPCDANGAFALLASTSDNYYKDNPNPGWYSLTLQNDWQRRAWCYEVTSVTGGVESAPSDPVEIWIGNGGYVDLQYRTECGGNGITVVPFPYMNGEVKLHLYYKGHEIPTVTLHNAFPYPANDPVHSYNQEWEWKTPVAALDGFQVPFEDAKGDSTVYSFTLDTPDGGHYNYGSWAPLYQTDQAYYDQDNFFRVNGGPDCPIGHNQPGANYDFWRSTSH